MEEIPSPDVVASAAEESGSVMKWSPERRKKHSDAMKAYFKENPRVYSEEGRRKFREATAGPSHYGWKGDDVGYWGIHAWLRGFEKSGVCLKCGSKTKTQWANISGEYKRDIADYLELCQSCHFQWDSSRGLWGRGKARMLR